MTTAQKISQYLITGSNHTTKEAQDVIAKIIEEDAVKAPKHLWRIDDGERYTRGDGGLYTMDNSMMHKPWEYTYEALMYTKAFCDHDPCL